MNKIVSTVMLNWNTPEMTIQSVMSILKSNYNNIIVNVIDNGSTCENYLLLKEGLPNKANLFRIEENKGYAGGMNIGLQYVQLQQPDYFLIINNDTIIDKFAVQELVSTCIQHDNNCIVTGKVYHFDKKDVLQTVGNAFDFKSLKSNRIGYDVADIGQYDEESERQMIDDIFMLYPKTIFDTCGSYSPLFFLNYEQTDLIIRIKSKGYKVFYTPKAKLWHKGSFSSGGIGNPYMMYWEGKSKVILHRIHQDNFSFFLFFFRYISKVVWSVAKGLLKRLFFNKKSNLKSRVALLRGVFASIGWLMFNTEETGYNPYN